MTYPTLTVEVGFTSGATVAQASISWTDITGSVRSGTIKRGRSSELDDFQAGTAQLVLKNADRRYDPNHSAGPYYGNLLPMRPVRISATSNAVVYRLYTGFVTGWPQDYTVANRYAEVTLDCVDAFEVLRQQKLLSPALWDSEIAMDSPLLWFKLSETSGTAAFDSSGNGFHGTYAAGTTSHSTDGLVVASTDPAIQFDGTTDRIDGIPTDGKVAAVPFSVEFITSRAPGETPGPVWAQERNGGTCQTVVYSSGRIAVPNFDLSPSSPVPEDGLPHHVMVVCKTNSTVIWIDGVNSGSNATTAAVNGVFPRIGADSADVALMTGVLDEVVVYTSDLTSRVAAHYAAAAQPMANQTTGERIDALLDLAGWPAADRNIDIGNSTLSRITNETLAVDLLSAMKAVELAEGGQLFISGAGKVVFQSRQSRMVTSSSLTSQATFGDASGTEFPYRAEGFQLRQDRDLIRNSITAQRTGFAQILAEDATSIAAYQKRSYDLGTIDVVDNGDVTDRVNLALYRYKDPVTRLDSVTTQPIKPPRLSDSWTANQFWAACLGADISQRYTIKRRPQGVGFVISMETLVEGVQHDFEPKRWTSTFYLSPADAGGFWILGTSELGTATRLGA